MDLLRRGGELLQLVGELGYGGLFGCELLGQLGDPNLR
jgi:hypothetical protein